MTAKQHAGSSVNNHKYIFVVGGVMSGVGKGIATSSIGKILTARGFKVNLMKVDPYLNVDAGTMNPTEHGEVFVLESGLETDQDMGNYERFLGHDLGKGDYMTSGMVYQAVINRERNLGYGGKCVEAVPHVRDEIVARFESAAVHAGSDITVVEIGGTIGDFQNELFLDAARALRFRNPGHVLFVMVSYLPVPGTLGEMKTRPTQHAVRALNSYGIQADVIIARSTHALDDRRKEKLAVSCMIDKECIISAPDVRSVYDVPLNFEKDNLSRILLGRLGLDDRHDSDMGEWQAFADSAHNSNRAVKIAMVGKYFDTGSFVLSDSYLSVIEAIKYSSYALGVKPEIQWVNSKEIENGKMSVAELAKFDGVIVPGGFGESGIEGIIEAIRFARENKIPYFGLCYGMQLMAVEYARNVVGLSGANTTEIDPDTEHPIIAIMPEQKEKMENNDYGGTMRLGSYPCVLKEGTIAREAYGRSDISERHRHRYEVSREYVSQLEEGGMVFSGTYPERDLVEIAELPREMHPFMLGTQAHPELKARPLAPHPLFTAFIKAAMEAKK